MTSVDITKPVWRVTGRIADGRRQVVFVNATDKESAFLAADGQSFASFDDAHEIDSVTGIRK